MKSRIYVFSEIRYKEGKKKIILSYNKMSVPEKEKKKGQNLKGYRKL